MKTTCCVVGGGPAGIMLGYLLARAGIKTTVLEKHDDFFRDFRGDTVHPSTLQLLFELGLLGEFLKLPHSEVQEFDIRLGDVSIKGPSFKHLPARCRFVAFMPQWDFLNFLAAKAGGFPTFELLMGTRAESLRYAGTAVAGVNAVGKDGPLEIECDLVVACDGRHSTLREAAGLKPIDEGSPIDVLWMRIPRLPSDPGHLLAAIGQKNIMIMIDRNEYWQCAYVIPKGQAAEVQAGGLPAFRTRLLSLAAYLGSRVDALQSWDDVKLLSVEIDRLPRWWQPGLLFIGDAAHAMSPVGGVGINLAVQDAVAAANLLWNPLRNGCVSSADLAAVQQRRELPVRGIQKLQSLFQDRVMQGIMRGRLQRIGDQLRTALTLLPFLRDLAGRVVGLGFRPEHIESPGIAPAGR